MPRVQRMAKSKQPTPFALLGELERRGREHKAALPVRQEVKEQWVGVGFRLGGWRFVVPMGDVLEILTCPPMSRVPRAKPWVKGVANVRGNLLPIMDLNGYLGRPLVVLGRSSRVLVVDQEGVFAGLLVDEVLGLRHFFRDEWVEASTALEEELRPYVVGGFRRDDGVWHVFSMVSLVRSPQFLKAAG